MSHGTANNADTVFRLTAHLTETIVFLELGLSVFGLVGTSAYHMGFILWALLACFVGRALNIYPITFVYNLMLRKREARVQTSPEYVEDGSNSMNTAEVVENVDKIPWKTAHMLWFSGLRGAVSYALVRTFPDSKGNQSVFVVTTIFVVMATTFILGGSTELALQQLEVPIDVDEAKYLQSLPPKRLLKGWLHHFEHYRVRSCVIRDFERRYREDLKNNDEDSVAGDYVEHVEVTEQEHQYNVKKTSVFDFGQ